MSFCSELNAKLDTIIALLEQTPVCCDGFTYLTAPDYNLSEITGTVPQPVIDAGYATDGSDWAGYREYKCMAAHAMLDGILVALAEMQPLVEIGGFTFEAGLEILQSLGIIAIGTAAFGPIVVSGAVIVGLLLALKDPLLEALDQIAADVEDNRDALVCAMYNADGINSIAQAYKDEVDVLFGDLEAAVLKNLNIDYLAETYFLGAYGDADAAQAMADAGYDPDNYECPCTDTAIGKVVFLHGPCTSHALGDTVYEGEDIVLEAEETSLYSLGIALINLTEDGPVQQPTYWYCVDATGDWHLFSGIWRTIHTRSATTPFWVQGSHPGNSHNPLPARPFLIGSGNMSGASYSNDTNPGAAMTWRVYLTEQ